MQRREFLQKGAIAAAGAAAITTGFVPEILPAEAKAAADWTSSLKSLSPAEGQALLKMARQLYPHDKLSDAMYAKVVTGLDAEAKSTPDTAKLLHEGIAGLDQGGKKFVDLSADDQLAALKGMETSPFFQKVRGSEIVSLYNNPEVWKQFGYQGSAYEMGGYLKHGFDDLKWLPDPPEVASPKAAASPSKKVA
jgi:hypothetical protein